MTNPVLREHGPSGSTGRPGEVMVAIAPSGLAESPLESVA
jgi:hypothetical protein